MFLPWYNHYPVIKTTLHCRCTLFFFSLFCLCGASCFSKPFKKLSILLLLRGQGLCTLCASFVHPRHRRESCLLYTRSYGSLHKAVPYKRKLPGPLTSRCTLLPQNADEKETGPVPSIRQKKRGREWNTLNGERCDAKRNVIKMMQPEQSKAQMPKDAMKLQNCASRQRPSERPSV